MARRSPVATPAVFISHSAKDVSIAKAVALLLRDAFNLSPADIRCTSVEGYRLPGGTAVDARLRKEALEACTFVAILSSGSLSSTYVLFELGARWGAEKGMIPLLAPGQGREILRGPLVGLHTLSCDTESDLYQLISDVSALLSRKPNSPESYIAALRALNNPKRLRSEGAVPNQLHHVSLAVTDLKVSKRFYRTILKLRLTRRPKRFGFEGAWFRLPNGQQLHLVLKPDGTFRSKTLDFRDNHLALRVDDFRAAFNFLKKKGLNPEMDDSMPAGFPQCYILDPDGHVIEINAEELRPLPGRP